MPTISVIVPVYKVEKYINRCVDSILGQTYTDFELILVDDGSPDNSGAICDEYAAKDSRIVVIHQENGGLSAARNAGIDWAKANSCSEWISFIDSDDWVHQNFLENLFIAAKQHHTTVSCCNFQKVKDDEQPEQLGKLKACICSPEDVYCANNSNGVDAYAIRYLYNKKLFDGVEFPLGKLYEDVFTTHKLIFKERKIAFVNQPLYYYFQRSDSIAHSIWTVKQLDIIEGYETIMRDFENTDNARVMTCAIRGYLSALHTQYSNVLVSDLLPDKKRMYLLILRQKLRRTLINDAKKIGVTFTDDNYLYSAAFPHYTALYWFIHAVLNKIKRIIYK